MMIGREGKKKKWQSEPKTKRKIMIDRNRIAIIYFEKPGKEGRVETAGSVNKWSPPPLPVFTFSSFSGGRAGVRNKNKTENNY